MVPATLKQFVTDGLGVFFASPMNERGHLAPEGKYFVQRADRGEKTARDGRAYAFDGRCLRRVVAKPKGKAAAKAAKRERQASRRAAARVGQAA